MFENIPSVSVNFKIQPFGQIFIEMKGGYDLPKEEKEITPIYTEPKTTDVKSFEIMFDDGNYIIPQTTIGNY